MNKNNFELNPIKEKVLERIKNQRLKMKPRWHFILKTILMVGGALIILLTLIYLISLIGFVLHQSGLTFLPAFGWPGLMILLSSLPWFILAGIIIFIGVLGLLVRHHPISYRKPLIYSLLAILILITIGGLISLEFGFHQNVWQRINKGPMEFLYRSAMPHPENVHIGLIEGMTEEEITIINDLNEKISVSVSSETRFPRGMGFQVGDQVIIWGRRDNGSIRAFGMGRFDNRFDSQLKRPSLPNSQIHPRINR